MLFEDKAPCRTFFHFPGSLVFALLTVQADVKFVVVSEAAVYVDTGQAVNKSGLLLYSIPRRCLFCSFHAKIYPDK